MANPKNSQQQQSPQATSLLEPMSGAPSNNVQSQAPQASPSPSTASNAVAPIAQAQAPQAINNAVVQSNSEPTEFIDYSEFSGMGREDFDKRDKVLPYIILLQGKCPQLVPGEKRIAGAEEGDIYSTFNNKIYKKDSGIIVNAALYDRKFLEYEIDANGKLAGFVKEHHKQSNIPKQCSKQLFGKKEFLTTAQGTVIIDKAFYFLLVHDPEEPTGYYPAVTVIRGTKFDFSSKWNGAMNFTTIKQGNKIVSLAPPLGVWRLTTGDGQKAGEGEIFYFKIWKYEFIGPLQQRELIEATFAYREQILQGLKSVDHMADISDEDVYEPGADDDEDIPYEETANAVGNGNANAAQGQAHRQPVQTPF